MLPLTMAAKEKIGSWLAAWLCPLLLLLAAVAAAPTASALTPGAAETRAGQKSLAALETRQAQLLQPAGLHQENASAVYDFTPESLLAAKTTAGASDDVVRLFHQGNLRGGQVSSTRALSTSPSSDLLHYNPQGQLFEFQVPRSTLNQWEQQGFMLRLQDLHAPSGIVTPEIRILPPASGQMNQFLIRPPGG